MNMCFVSVFYGFVIVMCGMYLVLRFGMNLCACMDIFLLCYLFTLSLHMCGVCGICALFTVSFIIHLFATLLEVGGNSDGWRVTVCAYTLICGICAMYGVCGMCCVSSSFTIHPSTTC